MSITVPRVRMTRPRTRERRLAGGASAVLFVAPFLLFYVVVYVAPILYSAVQSLFTQQSSGSGFGGKETVFAGLDNYARVLTDTAFWESFGRVLLFGIIQVPVMLGLATVLALLLDSAAARWVSAFRLIYFLPYAIPGVIAAVIWSYLYTPSLSPFVQTLGALGVGADFLGANVIIASMANITTWCWTGYNMLIILASLQAIPRDNYEAARLDGASEWVIATRVKLPQIGSALVLTGTLSVIGTIQVFNEPTILRTITSSVDSQFMPMMYAQNEAFTNNDFTYAAAASVVIALIAGALSVLYNRLTRRIGS